MGTLVRIKLFAPDSKTASAAFRAAFDRIRELDAILSDYAPDSELNRLCAAPAGQPVTVSEDLFRVLLDSQNLAGQTGGAFDVTLGPVIRLWREARKENRLPDADALREASSRGGYRKLHLDAEHRTVTLDQPGMQLDLGAIAKGYAGDAALETLRRLGIRSALVAVSGDIVCGDAPPGKPGWRVGIDPGNELDDGYAAVLELNNAAVSTSGDAEQHLDAGGQRYSHIVDPVTRAGLTGGVSVSVVAPRGMQADSLATAVSLLGPERGRAFIEKQPEVAAMLVVRENGTARRIESSRFARWKAAARPELSEAGVPSQKSAY